MASTAPWYVYTAAALLAAPLLVPLFAAAQGASAPAAAVSGPHRHTHAPAKPPGAAARGVSAPAAAVSGPQRHTRAPTKPPGAGAPTAAGQPRQPPPRTPFTAADEAAAAIPDMPDARFWADSTTDFTNALPAQPGPWLALSSGGADGAFGAGLLNGLSESGKRPDYAVVTGVSTGALMAPFVFAGPRYDAALRAAYTKISAADIFEVGGTGESFVDSWPLKDLIAKQITPALLDDIAAAHRSGRRLFVVTTDLDAERSVVWNMGAIAVHGGDAALKLFRNVLLASSAIPGGFPPVLIDVAANGKSFQEMHVDGGVGGQFFVAPAALMASTSEYRLPATQLYVLVNSGLQPDFQVVERSLPSILTKTVGAAVKVDTRLMIDRSYLAAKRSGVDFNVASIPSSFNAQSRGPFDPEYMGALFQAGYELGKSATPFSNLPPPYPGQPAPSSEDTEKAGANR
jgi:predicted acylesterase/phospholipase RssA